MTIATNTHEITEGSVIPPGFSHAIRDSKEYLFFRNERVVVEFSFPTGIDVTCDVMELTDFENPHFSFGEDVA